MRAFMLFLLLLGACQAPMKPINPASAAESTFRVQVHSSIDASGLGLGTLEHDSFGTAWVVANEQGVSQLVTAGHVCKDAEVAVPDELGGGTMPQASVYTLMGRDGSLHMAEVDRDSEDPDLCLLTAFEIVGPPMPIAAIDPVYDEPVAYVGAPSIIWGDGMAPMFRGSYAGGNLITAPTAGGASGSAVFTQAGVVGVLVRVNSEFNGLTFIEPRAHLITFLKDASLL